MKQILIIGILTILPFIASAQVQSEGVFLHVSGEEAQALLAQVDNVKPTSKSMFAPLVGEGLVKIACGKIEAVGAGGVGFQIIHRCRIVRADKAE